MKKKYIKSILILLILYLVVLVAIFFKDRVSENSKQFVYLELPVKAQLPGNSIDYYYSYTVKRNEKKVKNHELSETKLETFNMSIKLRKTDNIKLDILVFLLNRIELLLTIIFIYFLMTLKNFYEPNFKILLAHFFRRVGIILLICFLIKLLLSYLISNDYFSFHLGKSESYSLIFFPRIILEWSYLFFGIIAYYIGNRNKSPR